MEEEERARIEADAMRRENVEQRLKSLEGKASLFQWAVLGAVGTLVANLWDRLQGVLDK